MSFEDTKQHDPSEMRGRIGVFVKTAPGVGISHVGALYRHLGAVHRFDFLSDRLYANKPFTQPKKRPTFWSNCEALGHDEQEVLAAALGAFRDDPTTLSYGLNPKGYRYDACNNTFVHPDRFICGGLTCASFLHLILDGLEMSLVDLSTWPRRPRDRLWAARMALSKTIPTPRAKLEAFRFMWSPELIRLQPAEMAAGFVANGLHRPLHFAEAEALAKKISKSL